MKSKPFPVFARQWLLFVFALLTLTLPSAADQPDLSPLMINADRTPTVGQIIYFVGTITNQGAAINSASVERVTLSSSPSTNDAIARVDFSTGININSNSIYATFDPIGYFKLKVPTNVVPGTNYYLIYEVDSGNQIAESNESNNTLVQQTIVAGLDLTPLSLGVIGLPTIGQSLRFHGNLLNQGNGFINSALHERVTLSTSPSTNDALARADYAPEVFINSNSFYTTVDCCGFFKLTVPTNIVPGTNYFFIYEVDPDNQIVETNETNNTLVQQTSIGVVEFVPSQLIALDPIAIANRPFSISYSVTNISSNSFSGNWSDRIVLSTTTNVAGGIYTSNYTESRILAAGNSYSWNRQLNIPPIPPGTNYYLIFDVDSGNHVPEFDEANNTRILQITITNLPPSITLLTPTNQSQQTTCVAVLLRLSASTISGSYAITNVAYYANATNLIGNATNSPTYSIRSIALPQGDYILTTVASDNFHLAATSAPVSISLRWPTNLHELRADIATNGDFVGCMCAHSGSNYLVQVTDAMQANPDWSPHVTNTAENKILIFTNDYTNLMVTPQRYFRAKLLP